MSDEELLEFMEEEGGGARTLKSLIVDVFDNHGNVNLMALRMFELYLAGVLRSSTKNVNVFGYATTTLSGLFVAGNLFDTNNDKIGLWANEAWLSELGGPSNQRVIGVYTTLVDFDDLVFNNGFSFNDGPASNTTTGANNTKIYTSQVDYTNTTFNETTGLVKIFDGALPIHLDLNEPQDYSVPLI